MPQVDFQAALRRQLGFLRSSCQSFDAGFPDESIRVAQCIRVLIHDTKNQKSVLAHLGAKNIVLTSTCLDIASKVGNPASLAFGARPLMFNGMGQLGLSSNGASYFPKLGDGMFRSDLPVEQWWTQTVFILDPDTWVSRKDVVLSAADKDGGAHVDASLTPLYERLIASGDLGYFADEHGAQIPITGHHYVALRQMGYELLDSPALLGLAVASAW
jgi:hypothetical protein